MATRRAFLGGAAAAGALCAARRLPAQAPTEPLELTLREAGEQIRRRAISPVELVRAHLDAVDRLEPRVNAFVTVTAEHALEQAAMLEAELTDGRWRGPLHGVPIVLKDNIDTAGIRTTAAGEAFENRVPDEDAEVYRRLRAAGAVLLGKANMHEYAYGGTSAITLFDPVRNPWDLERIPGGSSGGSAAAVAAGMGCAALGTDTLASIRQPAAYCGVVGLKATHGLASIRGIIPVAESLDHVGPLCRSVGDAALMLQAMAGYDPLDPVSIDAEPDDYAAALYRSASPLRIGVPGEAFFGNLHPDIERAMNDALDVLGGLGAGLRDVELPPPPDFAALLAEAYRYHERHLDSENGHELYDPVTLERLLAAGDFSAAEYIGNRRKLELARNAIARVFDDVDVLVTPTTPGLPERIANADNPDEAAGAESSVRNTVPFNLYGIPTISVPCGFSRSGLPIGMQISGPHLGESAVLTLAHAYEQVTPWHRRRPDLLDA